MLRFAWPLTTAVLSLALLSILAVELLAADTVIGRDIATRQAQLAASRKPLDISNAEIELVQTRWFGTPALYTPPPIAGTSIQFFDVQGDSQDAILASIEAADICKRYGGCAVDPAVPKGFALGLEGFDYAGGTYYTCYAPATTTLSFRVYVLLPRWSPPEDGSVSIDLVQRWNALAQVIYVHEAGHAAITRQDLAALNAQAHRLGSCNAVFAFWDNPHVFDKEAADQAAYHKRLHADCRPEIGCIPDYWMGW